MIHNLLNETKVTGVTKLLKAHVKFRSFFMGYCKQEQRKYLLVTKLAQGRICNTTDNCLSVFDHFVKLALKGLKGVYIIVLNL